MADRFFILGAQRTGTTLLRLVLGCHSRVQCHDEKLAFAILAQAHELRRDCALVGFKVPQLTEQFRLTRLRDDIAVRSNSPGIRNQYKREPILFMTRDPVDTVASMLTTPGWLQMYGGTVLAAKIAHDQHFAASYKEQIRRIERSPNPDVCRAALIWRYKTDALLDYRQANYPVIPVVYEQLVSSPEDTLRRICMFLGVQFEPSLLEHAARPHDELRPDGLAIGNTDPKRPIDISSVGRGYGVLARSQITEIVEIAGSTVRTRQCP